MSNQFEMSHFPQPRLAHARCHRVSRRPMNRALSLLGSLVICACSSGGGNRSPIADAGVDQVVLRGSEVVLGGSRSSDPENSNLTFAWSLQNVPPGSRATLTGETTATPSFVADVRGTYVVSLVVGDGARSSDADTLMVQVRSYTETPSVAAGAGPRAVVAAGLDGDTVADLVTANYYFGSVSTLLGNGHGTFQGEARYPVGPGSRTRWRLRT